MGPDIAALQLAIVMSFNACVMSFNAFVLREIARAQSFVTIPLVKTEVALRYSRPLPRERNWTNGFEFGPKTRGARDASRRSRSNRRKAKR